MQNVYFGTEGLKRAAYDPQREILELYFYDTASPLRCKNVSESLWRGLLCSPHPELFLAYAKGVECHGESPSGAWLKSMAYSPLSRCLLVCYKKENVCIHYENVPEVLWEALRRSPHPEVFLAAAVRGHFGEQPRPQISPKAQNPPY